MFSEKKLFLESLFSIIEIGLGRGDEIEAQLEVEEGRAENSKSSNSSLTQKNKEIAFNTLFPLQPIIKYHPFTGRIMNIKYPCDFIKNTLSTTKIDTLSINDDDDDDYDGEMEEEKLPEKEEANIIPEIIVLNPPKPQTPIYAINIDPLLPLPKDYDELVKYPHKFPFELDLFQKHAIYHLQRKESVFVAAHTSAGKTVVAEHAIATSLENGTRTFYTSPIKALSNQKFGDFSKTFPPILQGPSSTKASPQIGLLTGDSQLNTDAPCLIMTTEILRGMLYRQSNQLMDLEFVIFDEVHYVNDVERGVVWEEVIMMLPRHVTLIMLSATIPNTMEFADWVGRIRGSGAVRVINTQKRPIPLTHHLFMGSSADFPNDKIVEIDKSLACIVDASRIWRKEDYTFALGIERKRNQTKQNQQSIPTSLLSLLKRKSLLPAIIFFFSRNRLERQASSHFQSIDLCFGGAKERSQIHRFLNSSISRLRKADRLLPQVQRVREMLLRGVGIHHSGLLPILREAVEHLFARGHVRLLLATETFAMGVNMPAKTVIFSSLKKHDGIDHRSLTSSEYTQMAGRAGRRGLDERGVVIILEDQIGGEEELKRIILGPSVMLKSQFKLSYKMIISLISRAQQDGDDAIAILLSRSFGEAGKARQIPLQIEEYNQLKEEKQFLKANFETMKCEHHINIDNMISGIRNHLFKLLNLSNALLSVNTNLLRRGRLLLRVDRIWNFMVGIVVCDFSPSQHLKVVFMPSLPVSSVTNLPVPLKTSISCIVEEFTNFRGIILLDHVIENKEESPSHLLDLLIAWRLSGGGGGVFTAYQNMLKNLEGEEMIQTFLSLVNGLPSLEDSLISCCPSYYMEHLRREDILLEIDERMSMVFETMSPLSSFMPEYNERFRYLVKNGFCTEDSLLSLKGRVAGEFSVMEEISSTELLFSGQLSDKSILPNPSIIVALVSGFIFQDRMTIPNLDHISSLPLKKMITEVDQMIQLLNNIQSEHFTRNQPPPFTVNWGIAEVVWRWVEGDSFGDIMANLYELLPSSCEQPLLEGTIVRTMVRIGEGMGELIMAVKIMSGTAESSLLRLLEDGQLRLKRDICFAPSLYLS